ncbi:hypothetical protein IJT10_04530 [bacterium]|nr:hypothetical protein [bacterium]
MLKRLFFLILISISIIFIPAQAWSQVVVEDLSRYENFRLVPKPESKVTEETPCISVTYKEPKDIDFTMTRLWVNDREVTDNCLKTPNSISFQPFTKLPEDTVKVKALIHRKNSQKEELSWKFFLGHPQAIEEIIIPKKEYQTYEDLQITVKAKPNCKAWFDIEDFRENIPLEEDPHKPGTYTGTYIVKYGDNCLKAQIVAHVQSGNQIYSKKATESIVIWGELFQIAILEPKEGAEVPLKFKIKGRTAPNCNVSIIPKIGFDNLTSANTKSASEDPMGSIPVISDENGYFETDYGFIIKLPNMQAVITIIATDQKGNRSAPKSVRIKFK